MKSGELLSELRATLSGVEDGGLCAEWIVEELTEAPRLALGMCRDKPVERAVIENAREWAVRVLACEPIQYVVGWTSFRGHRIRTDRRALIPRPETEELVSRVRGKLTGPARIADVGTGTGCIAIALCLEHPGAEVRAIDREADALALAAENVADHGLGDRIQLSRGDLLGGIAAGSLDVVVSNPPYVSEAELAGLPENVRGHEPVSALVAEAGGLGVIRRLIPQARGCLKPGGSLLLEIGETQGVAVAGLLAEAGFIRVAVHRDLAGRERIAEGIVAGSP